MSPKSFFLTLARLVRLSPNTLLDSAVEAAQTYFHFHTSTYKRIPMATRLQHGEAKNK
jgi:hypothetical protein